LLLLRLQLRKCNKNRFLCEKLKPLITQKAKLNKKIDLVGEILQGLFLRLSTL